MRWPRLKLPLGRQIADRLAPPRAGTEGGADLPSLDARLAALEDQVRRLQYGDEDLAEIDDAIRGCRELVGDHVPAGERVALATGGNPALISFDDRSVAAFPPTRIGSQHQDFDHDAAAIANLEAQRAHGTRFLLLPEPAREWLQRYPGFAEHLLSRYAVVADEAGTGLLVEIGTRRVAQKQQATLAEVLDRVVDGDRYAPVLDWTRLDLQSLTAGRNVFPAPVEVDGELPYLDRTIDVVVLEDPVHLEEGRRVARGAVIMVSPDEDGHVVVTAVHEVVDDGLRAADPIPLVVTATGRKDPWLRRLEDAVAEQPRVKVVAGGDPGAVAAKADSEVVVLAERGVLPLPGCIEAAVALLTSSAEVGAVAVKLLAADGSLESAGTTVFADGSVEGVAAGFREVAAPWHEYVRPVCAGTGLLAVRPSAAREASGPLGSLLELSVALWGAGYEVRYQPDAWAVRVLDQEAEDAAPQLPVWDRTLPARPVRPLSLDTTAWRALLAEDDVEGLVR
jgi:hypothetical protein